MADDVLRLEAQIMAEAFVKVHLKMAVFTTTGTELNSLPFLSNSNSTEPRLKLRVISCIEIK